jgi:hypothetical protein
VLSTIADQEHPGIILACMFHEPQHLRYAQHRCLVNYKHVRAFRPELESLKRSCLESGFAQIIYAGVRWRKDGDTLAHRGRSLPLLEQMRFPGSSNPGNIHDQVR